MFSPVSQPRLQGSRTVWSLDKLKHRRRSMNNDANGHVRAGTEPKAATLSRKPRRGGPDGLRQRLEAAFMPVSRTTPSKKKKRKPASTQASNQRISKKAAERKPHSWKEIVENHGYLWTKNIPELIRTTNYNRHELYEMFGRFKALCSLAPSAEGIGESSLTQPTILLFCIV